MQSRLTTKPAQDVFAEIQNLNLETVKLRMMDPELGEGWTREYADSIETAYKNYLVMLVKYQEDAEDIMLSKDVDEFWHTHILQTQKYTEDCERMFGTYLHHNPHVGERTAADLEKREAMAAKTRSLYEREFGGSDRANAAWSGASNQSRDVAYSAASLQAKNGAYSAASIRPQHAAYSAASIKSDTAAYSAASISSRTGAYSAASIRPQHAAYSAASIKSDNAAYSAASISSRNGAYSAASIRPQHAAYSAASIKSDNAAYSAASISSRNGAYSAASVRLPHKG